jgi:hypothetical protein
MMSVESFVVVGAAGVAGTDAAMTNSIFDSGPKPAAFLASTLNMYSSPGVRPVTVKLVSVIGASGTTFVNSVSDFKAYEI